ncbi:hypothetical protein PV10_03427 [Exophiala mesophila]|uniref:Arylsulfatase n=1 Tax=Exophiala mesophila TaxID=212818 RepID=A0A0D1Y551_EXOME|nr:uncharacterized protein PV10_03427 [Exophiala mesophila]KIV95821.1 hypothetical protein PV10_03427 [Exophiala mesophila]
MSLRKENWPPRGIMLNMVRLSLRTFLVSLAIALVTGHTTPSKRSNVILVITDDQDLHLNSLEYMPITLKHFRQGGTEFRKHYCTIAVCCPSRVSLLTGKMAHNTNVTDVSPPYGGYPKFLEQGLNENYLPVWLQEAGYNTYYTGKLMNAHSLVTYNDPYPAGWNRTGFLIDPGTYNYYNACWQSDQNPPVWRAGEYNTDIVSDAAMEFLDEASKSDRPFFLGVAPIAPHTEVEFLDDGNVKFIPPIPAKRHEGLFLDAKIPRGPSFNPEEPQGVNWIQQLPRANETEVEANDDFYRARLQSLQAVDELVGALVEKVEQLGLDDTYIIYTTDNGFHMGQHRLQPGKTCAYEEDVNVPFLVRGPDVPKNHVVDFATSHTDIAATIFDLLNIPLRDDFDGVPIPLTLSAMEKAALSPAHGHVTIEFWGVGVGEGLFSIGGPGGSIDWWANNTYKGLRLVSPQYDLLYTVWCNNVHELYDMKVDPYQTKNMYYGSGKISGYSIEQVTSRLDALLMVTKSCKGEDCTNPWRVLHPCGRVHNLAQALAPELDLFYASQPKISFTKCELGYIIDSEGPMEVLPFHIGD